MLQVLKKSSYLSILGNTRQVKGCATHHARSDHNPNYPFSFFFFLNLALHPKR